MTTTNIATRDAIVSEKWVRFVVVMDVQAVCRSGSSLSTSCVER
jgi:hypothetical protein